MAKRKRKIKRKVKIFIFFIICGGIFGFVYLRNENIRFHLNYKLKMEKEQEEKEAREKEKKYNLCLNKAFDKSELTEEINRMKFEIDSYIKTHYIASIKYEDMTSGFSYEYKARDVYYGASLIKIVDALYLINKAINGEINLDTETMTYTSKYKMAFSSGMAQHSFGDEVTLRELITHAIQVSDNSAHMMLIDYIGFSNLKEYGQSLGAKVILTGGDNFGNQTVEDTNIYLKEAYRIINENQEYGSFLKNIMDNNEQNAYNTEMIKVYHKYGSYANYYHDIGLRLDIEHPYAISILSSQKVAGSDSEIDRLHSIAIQDIHNKIIALHDAFYENRKQNCHLEVYGS